MVNVIFLILENWWIIESWHGECYFLNILELVNWRIRESWHGECYFLNILELENWRIKRIMAW